ncbi:ATP-binding protein [Umezawaea sp. NPDC059074]|uniref:ATP-binding protein n=1 Tax=Umezawaea sp. NPDC059074 TaxID=3346716 RepID=UPI0036852478
MTHPSTTASSAPLAPWLPAAETTRPTGLKPRTAELTLSPTSQVYLPAEGTRRVDLLVMPIDRDDLAVVREWIRRSLSWCGPEVIADVEVVATELATNAVTHARRPRQITVVGYLPTSEEAVVGSYGTGAETPVRQGEAVIEVLDGSRDHIPLITQRSTSRHGGRGMRLVRTLSRSWGVLRGERTKTVWAALPLT